MPYQEEKVKFYEFILQILEKNNKKMEASKLISYCKRNFGYNTSVIMDALNTLKNTKEIDRTKNGDDVFIIKL
jgi:hypothetical protein